MAKRAEFTIDEIMQDSMIRLLMKADRVDPVAFEARLRALAAAEPDEEADDDVDDSVDRKLMKACASRGNPCRHAPPGTPMRP